MDYDLPRFLKRCRKSLTKTGAMLVKENVSENGRPIFSEDSSIIRPRADYVSMLREAGFRIVYVGR
jgi:hypothetical protein